MLWLTPNDIRDMLRELSTLIDFKAFKDCFLNDEEVNKAILEKGCEEEEKADAGTLNKSEIYT